MKLCVPTVGQAGLKEKVNAHFGSAPCFTVVDLDNYSLQVIDNSNAHHEHGTCNPTAAIAGQGVDAVVCGGMGMRAVQILNGQGIKVYITDGETVEDVVNDYKAGNLAELTPDRACAGHDCH